jgi:hypothetical protein
MIEFLEPRIVPSGLIDITLVKGSLFLKSVTGDAGDETAVIARVGETGVQITPGSGVAIRFERITKLPGQPLSLTGFNGQLTAALGGGNDAITLEGGSYGDVRIDLGDAGTTGGTSSRTNYFTANGVTFSKSLTYIGGNGGDVVELKGATTSVAGALNISLGNGANQLLLTAADFHAAAGMNVRAGSGDDLLLFQSAKLAVVGDLKIASGAGSDTVQFTSSISELGVTKSLAIASSGSRSVAIEQSITGVGKITIGGALTMTAGTGDRLLQSLSGTVGTLSIAGDIAFSATNPTPNSSPAAMPPHLGAHCG